MPKRSSAECTRIGAGTRRERTRFVVIALWQDDIRVDALSAGMARSEPLLHRLQRSRPLRERLLDAVDALHAAITTRRRGALQRAAGSKPGGIMTAEPAAHP